MPSYMFRDDYDGGYVSYETDDDERAVREAKGFKNAGILARVSPDGDDDSRRFMAGRMVAILDGSGVKYVEACG